MKFSENFERDYKFYYNNIHNFTFSGSEYSNMISDKKGRTAKECFHLLDSRGKKLPCQEIILLRMLLNCKASVNLNIKMWAQGRAEYTLSLEELKEMLNDYCAPSWVLEAVENQKFKISKQLTKNNFNFQNALFNAAEELDEKE
jgi:hypothetical protein